MRAHEISTRTRRAFCEVFCPWFCSFLTRPLSSARHARGWSHFRAIYFALLAGCRGARIAAHYARRRPKTSRTTSLAHLCGRGRGPLPHIHMGSLACCSSLGRLSHHIHNHDHLRRGLPRGGGRSAAAGAMAPARGGGPRAGPDAAGDRAAHRRAAAAAMRRGGGAAARRFIRLRLLSKVALARDLHNTLRHRPGNERRARAGGRRAPRSQDHPSAAAATDERWRRLHGPARRRHSTKTDGLRRWWRTSQKAPRTSSATKPGPSKHRAGRRWTMGATPRTCPTKAFRKNRRSALLEGAWPASSPRRSFYREAAP